MYIENFYQKNTSRPITPLVLGPCGQHVAYLGLLLVMYKFCIVSGCLSSFWVMLVHSSSKQLSKLLGIEKGLKIFKSFQIVLWFTYLSSKVVNTMGQIDLRDFNTKGPIFHCHEAMTLAPVTNWNTLQQISGPSPTNWNTLVGNISLDQWGVCPVTFVQNVMEMCM